MGLREFLNKPAPQWAQSLGRVIPSARNFASALERTPKASVNFKNPIARGAANIALDSTVNIPSNLLRSWGKTVGGFTNNASARQQIGNVGELGLNLASAFPISKAVGAFKGAMQAPSQRAIANAITSGAKTGLKFGAGYGAGYGATGALQENQGALETMKRALLGGTQGALFGGVLGGAIPAAGSLRTTLGNSIRNRMPGQITNERIPAHLYGNRKIFNAERPLPEGYYRAGRSGSPAGFETGGIHPREIPGVYGMRKLAAQEVERGRLSPTLTDWRKGLGEAIPRPGMSIKAVDDPLLQEARSGKYANAEEFVKAQENTIADTLYLANKEAKKFRDTRRLIKETLFEGFDYDHLFEDKQFKKFSSKYKEKYPNSRGSVDDVIEKVDGVPPKEILDEINSEIDDLDKVTDKLYDISDEAEEVFDDYGNSYTKKDYGSLLKDYNEKIAKRNELEEEFSKMLTKSDLHSMLKENFGDSLYQKKEEIIKKLGVEPVEYHKFISDEENVYPMYKIGDKTFHSVIPKENFSGDIKKLKELEEIPSESLLGKEFDEKDLDYLLENIKTKSQLTDIYNKAQGGKKVNKK